MRIVGIDASGKGRIQKSRADRIATGFGEENRGTALPLESRHVVTCPAAPLRVRADRTDAEVIEKEIAQRIDDGPRQVVAAQRGRKAGQYLGRRPGRIRPYLRRSFAALNHPADAEALRAGGRTPHRLAARAAGDDQDQILRLVDNRHRCAIVRLVDPDREERPF